MKWRLAPMLLCVCNTPYQPDSTIDAGSYWRPPPPPVDASPPSSETWTFAIDDVFLGDADRNGVYNLDAWKGFGYDLDKHVTYSTSTDVCTRALGAGSSSQADGHDGIDNAFGRAIVPLLSNLQPEPSKLASSIIHGGRMLQIQVTGLTADTKQSSNGLTGRLFPSGPYDGGFAWTTSMEWPVLADGLGDRQTLSTALYAFGGYVSSGTVVVDTSVQVVLRMILAKYMDDAGQVTVADPIELRIHRAIVTCQADGSKGVIAGIIDPEELVVQMRRLVTSGLYGSFCTGSLLDGIAATIRKSVDIMLDGTNSPGPTCNGISAGIGFSAKRIANPTSVVDEPLIDRCDAGGD